MIWPNPVSNTSLLGSWLNKFRDACQASEIKPGLGYKVRRSSGGTVLEIDRQTKSNAIPFEIYQSGTWLEYKVRDGIYIDTGNPVTVIGTETTITISSGVLRYWFYLDVDLVEIKSSATTLEWSATKIPLGWVDTQTGSSSEVATITQVWRDHIFNPCTE